MGEGVSLTLPPLDALANDLREIHGDLTSPDRLVSLTAALMLLDLIPDMADYFERAAREELADPPVVDLG